MDCCAVSARVPRHPRPFVGHDAPATLRRCVTNSWIPLNLNGRTDLPNTKIAAVATYLDLHSPPAPVEPPQPGLVLRHLANPDLDEYLRLYTAIGEPWLWFSRRVMPRTAVAQVLGDPAVEVHVAYADDCAAGLIELDFRDPLAVEIAFFGVTPEFVGRGLGKWLMGRAIALAQRAPARRIWLHTCTLDHPRALPFYLAHGFVATRRVIEVVDDPRQTGALPPTAGAHVPRLATGE